MSHQPLTRTLLALAVLSAPLLAPLPAHAQARPQPTSPTNPQNPTVPKTPTTPAANSWQAVFFDAPGVALPRLTAAAVQHSAQLRATGLDREISDQDLTLARRNLLASVELVGNYNYGNLASISLVDPQRPNQFNTFSSNRYFAGVNFVLPLDRIVNRGTLLRRGALLSERNEALRQERENLVRQQIIQLYQNVLLARRLLTLRQEAFVAVQTSYQLAERQFRQGQLPLVTFSQVSTQLTDANIAQTTARGQYDTSFMLLEEVVGARISSLLATP